MGSYVTWVYGNGNAITFPRSTYFSTCKAEEMIIFMFGILSHTEIGIALDFPLIIDLILV